MKAWVVDTKVVIDGKVSLLKTFTGPDAEAKAVAYIGSLPQRNRALWPRCGTM